VVHCEICDLNRDYCQHGHEDREAVKAGQRRDAAAAVPLLRISPARLAHFPGCPHKGDDPDYSQWGELDTPNAWALLGAGQQLPATGGEVPSLVAVGRCRDCEDHGPWN
jgi:hypothetical protein